MEKNIEKLIMSKLRQPIHKSYVCKYILRDFTKYECEEHLKRMMDDGLIEESPLAAGYLVVKSIK